MAETLTRSSERYPRTRWNGLKSRLEKQSFLEGANRNAQGARTRGASAPMLLLRRADVDPTASIRAPRRAALMPAPRRASNWTERSRDAGGLRLGDAFQLALAA
jgi:hypothetical protein